MSVPLKIMYSYTSSRAATGISVGRSSVPKDRTVEENTCVKKAEEIINVINVVAVVLLTVQLAEAAASFRILLPFNGTIRFKIEH